MMVASSKILLILIDLLFVHCQEDGTETSAVDDDLDKSAEIVSVEVTGSEKDYRFSVGIESPGKGCEQYADWWEVVSLEGDLLYRRVLAHSHVQEQPFVRSGGPVEISAGTKVIVRAHMHPFGYSAHAFEGTVSGGFKPVELAEDFASELEEVQPQPGDCAF